MQKVGHVFVSVGEHLRDPVAACASRGNPATGTAAQARAWAPARLVDDVVDTVGGKLGGIARFDVMAPGLVPPMRLSFQRRDTSGKSGPAR
ncbi:hypothetical protein [Caballeronia arvi]|uniref:hypothetical protein n=1 Tax=Caballeronia arvi TaxID=1777135 RepID=UPI0011803082|nr:hypothetical protein [Caballeronia arvi]